MATSVIESRTILHSASSWADAYSKAESMIIVIAKGYVNPANVALTLTIPKDAVDASLTRYWEVSDGYGSGGHTHFQLILNNGAFNSAALYNTSGQVVTGSTISYYYI